VIIYSHMGEAGRNTGPGLAGNFRAKELRR